MQTVGEFVATHTVPGGGTRAWADPDPAAAAVATLDAGLPVRVLEAQPNGWAHVLCSNGWTAWVDGRVLQPVDVAAPVAAATTAKPSLGTQFNWLFQPIETGPLSLGGAAAAVLGGFLPWLTLGSTGASAWDLGVVALLRGHGPNSGVMAGVALVVVALVALPRITHKPLPAIAVAALGGLATNVALLALIATSKEHLHAHIGVGLLLTLAGGAAILADFYLGLQRAHPKAAA